MMQDFLSTSYSRFVVSAPQLLTLCLCFSPGMGQIAEIYILSQPFMLQIMATGPPVINLHPNNFSLEFPAAVAMLTQRENSTIEHIVSMDFVSLGIQGSSLWAPSPFLLGITGQQPLDVWSEG